MRAHHYVLLAVVLFVGAVLAFVVLSEPPLPQGGSNLPVATRDPSAREVIPPPDDIAPVADATLPGPSAAEVAAAVGTRVSGQVRNESGHAVARVRIIPPAPSGEPAPNFYTESDGAYRVDLVPISGRSHYEVRFLADGYEPYLLKLSAADLDGDRLERDIELAILGERAEVSGTLSDSRGGALEGIHVQFYSTGLSERYDASTDRFGAFEIPQVKPASDYQILIQPGSGYQDYSERGIVVTSTGLTLDLVVEALGAGRLSGQLVDPEGNPIPNMSFTVRSDRSVRVPLEASSDSSGYFSVDDVPAGRLTFSAKAGPSLKVRGLGLDAGQQRDVLVVFDWGRHSMRGRVVDDRGNPVAGAQVAVSWMQQDGMVRSSSTRTAATGADGAFVFDKLGPGPHRVDVSASGHESAGGEFGSSSPIEVRIPRQDG